MDDLVKVAEFGDRDSMVEVYQKFSSSAQKVFFDVSCATECVEGAKRYLSPVVHVDGGVALAISVLEAMEYISVRHAELRKLTVEPKVTPLKNSALVGLAGLTLGSVHDEYTHVKEFKRGSVVVELLTKEVDGVDIFHLCCCREFLASTGNLQREFLIQQRDLRDLAMALLTGWTYYRDNWITDSPIKSRRW